MEWVGVTGFVNSVRVNAGGQRTLLEAIRLKSPIKYPVTGYYTRPPTGRVMNDKAERLASMKQGKVVAKTELFCDQCGFELTVMCNGCNGSFGIDEDIICDRHELVHYCQGCIERNKEGGGL